ncbi:SufS family cysteine desulfurase [Gryllotalpicola reticulitermitis]|uniref:Cysteine desulfurase n=1 Tax=Gryllotalpicola reticulitermitis TaxID=1184153 RepID=A0ABV8Q983_9MICO
MATLQALADLRADFPLLDQTVNGHPLVYLDSAATAQRPSVVLDAERDFLERRNAAVHRGAHTLAAEATEEFEQARAAVARFVGARPEEIAWQLNATDALNTIAFAIGAASRGRGGGAGSEGITARRFALHPGDELVVTEAEHHANLIPWQELAAQTGATLRYVPVDDDGLWTIDDARAVVTDKTRLIAFAHVSNVTGMVAPVPEMVALAASVGALTVLDACQSAPHRPLDLDALGVDFAAFSAHKMLGPTGLGVLYGRRELLNALPPGRTGGSMITTVTMEGAEFLPAPQRFEAGTQPVSQAVALGAAVGYLESAGRDAVLEHERALAARLYDGLAGIPGLRLIGPGAGAERAGLVAFDVAGVHAHDAGQYLDSRGIAVRVGHHCAQPLHRRLGLTASVRASVYVYNTEADVDTFLEAAAGIRHYFGL